MIKERLRGLRGKMKAEGIDAYLVFSDDYHGSEYVGDYFKCREFITGFSGSAGSAVIMQDMAGLWTDGRYFLQAEKQLDTKCYKLFKEGEEGVPSLQEFLQDVLEEGQCVGFDGRTVSGVFVEGLQDMLAGKGISFWTKGDLIGEIWEERPAISKKPVIEHELCYSGMMRQVKQAEIRTMMEEKNADMLLVSALDDIAWLTNMRGDDVEYSPVFLAYGVVTKDCCIVFGQKESFSQKIRGILAEVGIEFRPYDGIYDFIRELPKLNLWVDKKRTNYALLKCIPENMEIIDGDHPIMLRKAIKNDIEIDNVRYAHIKDGIAITKFLYWLSQNVGNGDVTEISAAEKLEVFRREQEYYQGSSFAPIFAYGAHGAIVHYSADEESDAVIAGNGLLLLDTGGHYLDGSTDVTRTVAIGEVTKQQKSHYTAVLKGNLNLAAAKFRYGCSGVNLDYLARQPLWEQGLDYNHGTGHGVGFMLNVHEGPNSIRWKPGKDGGDVVLQAGMITSDEPGFYLLGEYGIRLENLILCKEAGKTEYGQFMEFETLTMVPFDRNCINPQEMSVKELALLNAYHERVFELLEPHLQPEERLWLKEATRPLSKFS